ncbi:NifB/NifX family molybdenum-iron cluster-binding protein [Methanobrevibacter filiformis]|uniref:Dinitrogenase iron-molybdenum cofactor n=1 Tax=Methanobrevibacter filiformis TaxID=55758 RepID=A0A166CPU7_9EURY|nr:NifB/NifX family molybdenum-iron cluster-binding protein [Methanobrevibacter filiformis]KZX14741.1 dinitrogenase iron-molybdenum cofactor [Methanobrevibacter filiformis]
MKIAIASSDGENVDLHFGKANSLYIYNFDGDTTNFIEKRTVDIDEDERHQWTKVLDKIQDCDVIIAVQFGFKSKFGIEEAGLKIVVDEGLVIDALKGYVDHYTFMKSPL